MAFDFRIYWLRIGESDVRQPEQTSSGAGRSRKRERYIARYKGEEYDFGSLEQLEAFLEDIKKSQVQVPKKARSPIKITLSPDYIEEIPAEVQIPRRLDSMPVGVAMSQIRKIDQTLSKLLAEAERKAAEMDEEECLMCIL